MQIPPEFAKVGRNIHQDIGLIVNTKEEFVDAALGGLTDAEKIVVRKFLDKVLSKAVNGASLRNVWRATKSDIYFRKGDDLLTFFTMMRDRLQ
jgi:hypothetical protein